MEISSDILAVREKCLWKFPAPDISTVPINVGEVSSEEKVAVEISSDIFAVRENVGGNF